MKQKNKTLLDNLKFKQAITEQLLKIVVGINNDSISLISLGIQHETETRLIDNGYEEMFNTGIKNLTMTYKVKDENG